MRTLNPSIYTMFLDLNILSKICAKSDHIYSSYHVNRHTHKHTQEKHIALHIIIVPGKRYINSLQSRGKATSGACRMIKSKKNSAIQWNSSGIWAQVRRRICLPRSANKNWQFSASSLKTGRSVPVIVLPGDRRWTKDDTGMNTFQIFVREEKRKQWKEKRDIF